MISNINEQRDRWTRDRWTMEDDVAGACPAPLPIASQVDPAELL